MADDLHRPNPVVHLPYPPRPYYKDGGDTVLGVAPLGWAALMAIPTVLIVGMAVWAVFFDSDVDAYLATGNPAVLSIDGRSPITIARDQVFSQTALRRGSVLAAYETLVENGDAFTVDDGTAVRVIDIRLSMMRVRVVSGPWRGESGWVPHDWVGPLR